MEMSSVVDEIKEDSVVGESGINVDLLISRGGEASVDVIGTIIRK